MLRLGGIFVIVCMVLIAGSIGATLYLTAVLGGPEAGLVGFVILIVLVLYNAVTRRRRDRTDLGAQIADLSRGTADLARQVAELGRRTAQLEGQGDLNADKVRAAVAPISVEMGELGTLVKQLAESVAIHDATLAAGKLQPKPAETAMLGEPATGPAGRADGMTDNAMVAVIRGAIEANRVDLYLQPIVTLPQRKVRYYEALTRLRTEDGKLLLPPDFLAPAEASGTLPQIDQMLVFRSVQVVRRLLLKNRDVGLFCNIAAVTLNDKLFSGMVQFLEANRALAASLVLEFRQETWRGMGPLEHESLAALRDLGFRFCMDQVTDLRMEPRELGERGIRFVKVPATLLLGGEPMSGSDIHAADLSDLLNRHGIGLVADKIENESQVIDLLDYDLRFGQGNLFSPARPVRAEALADGEATAGETPRPAA